MRSNLERLAWIVLWTSFFTCISLAVAVPLGIRHTVLHATVIQDVTLEVQRGPLRVTLAGRGEPFAVDEERDEVPERTIVATDATAGRLVMHAPGEERTVVATVQLYENTEVILSSGRSPRFRASHLPHRAALEMRSGKVRVSVSDGGDRPTIVEVHIPYGRIVLREGRFAIEVDPEKTTITVQEGVGFLTSFGMTGDGADQAMALSDDQRATMTRYGSIAGPLPAARDLIVNGDFVDSLEEGWASYSKDVQIDGESGGEVRRVEVEGRPVIVITRTGLGHAETGIRQQLDTDIRDFSYLQLHLLLRIEEQNVPVCGSLGSECPVMVRIAYKDADGADQEWLQGFYSLPDPGTPGNPAFCVTCSVRNEHIRAPQATWYPYDSPNLIPLISQDGRVPVLIKSITVYASGHTYESMIAEVELIGQE